MSAPIPTRPLTAEGSDERRFEAGPQFLDGPRLAEYLTIEVAGEDGQRLMPGLFALLREPAWRDALAVDLAGVLAADRLDEVLRPLLQHPQFFGRLRYASDYPQSAIAASIRLSALVDGGFLDPALVAPLRELYDVNPLLFVFVTLRQVRLPATELRLPDGVFFGEPVS